MKRLLIVVFLVLISVSSYAQITKASKFKRPVFVIDVSGGYSLPLHDLTGSNVGEYYSFTDYAVNNGINSSIKGKYSVYTAPLTQLRLTAAIGYNHFWASDDFAYNVGVFPAGWPSHSYTPPGTTVPGESYIRLNVPEAALGMEFAFWIDPQLRNNMSIGVEALMSMITGRVFNTKYGQPETFNTLRDNVRIGFAVNYSYATRITENFGFNLGIKYSLRNLIGKDVQQDGTDGYMYLNDAAGADINPYLTNSRTIGDLSVYGGVSFFIGTKK